MALGKSPGPREGFQFLDLVAEWMLGHDWARLSCSSSIKFHHDRFSPASYLIYHLSKTPSASIMRTRLGRLCDLQYRLPSQLCL
jgi:hypothetical protein